MYDLTLVYQAFCLEYLVVIQTLSYVDAWFVDDNFSESLPSLIPLFDSTGRSPSSKGNMQLRSPLAKALLAGYALAQIAVPFTVDGPSETYALRLAHIVPTSLNTFDIGAYIKVYGNFVAIPDNLMVQFPAAWVSVQ